MSSALGILGFHISSQAYRSDHYWIGSVLVVCFYEMLRAGAHKFEERGMKGEMF